MRNNYTSKIKIHTAREQDYGDKQRTEDGIPYK
jgi:hypothetical protein